MAGKNTLAKLEPFSAVIFDLDGVITDTEPIYQRHLRLFLTELGVKDPQVARLWTRLKGTNSQTTWTILAKEFDLSHGLDELITISQDSAIEYLKSLKELPEIPGALDLIKRLHYLGYLLALATSANPRRAELLLAALKVKKYFRVIVHGEDVKKSKPDPEPFLLAAARLGVEPARCLVIEDAYNGVRAAKAAGMQCAAYGGSDHNTDDLSAADLIIKNFSIITDFLRPD